MWVFFKEILQSIIQVVSFEQQEKNKNKSKVLAYLVQEL